MPTSIGPGDLLAERYRLDVLLNESGGGRFWRAHDRILSRDVAVHVIGSADARADALMEAARRSAVLLDRRILRVLDADRLGEICYVVNEWADGESLDRLLETGPLEPERAAWIAYEVGSVISGAHAASLTHSRLNPENVLIDTSGSLRLIGFAVDAALSGVPTDDAARNIERDVHDLAGILYAGLTGRWAGDSPSERVAPAPREAGVLLRPRQVTAGIPSALDAVCDQVLSSRPKGSHARGSFDSESARGVTDALLGFLGDPSVQAAAEAQRARGARISVPRTEPDGFGHAAVADRIPTTPAGSRPAVADPGESVAVSQPVTEPVTGAVPPDPVFTPEADQMSDTAERGRMWSSAGQDAPAPPDAGDDRTQAGMPIFMADDHVEWLNAEPPAPPPVLPEPPPKPLFAPDPPAGVPVRRPRQAEAPAATDQTDSFWPFDSPTPAVAAAAAPSPGRRADRTVRSVPAEAAPPGRVWLRIAGAVGVALLLILAIGVAYNLGLGGSLLGSEPERSPEPSGTAAPPVAKLAPAGVIDFDPQGRPPREYPEIAGNVIDGNKTTSWHTSTYLQQLGPGALKTGVGVSIDLGAVHQVSGVDLRLTGPTGFSIFLTEESPTDPTDLEPAAVSEGDGRTSVSLENAVTARYVTIWLTKLPPVGNRFRGEISEVTVRGQ